MTRTNKSTSDIEWMTGRNDSQGKEQDHGYGKRTKSEGERQEEEHEPGERQRQEEEMRIKEDNKAMGLRKQGQAGVTREREEREERQRKRQNRKKPGRTGMDHRQGKGNV